MSRFAQESGFEPENDGQREALAFLRLEGSSQSSSPFPGVGERVADFVIEQELGRGGAGVVYRARQLGLGRSVALKLIPHGPAAITDAFALRLEREGRMLASVRHESIPTVHAAGVVPGFHYVAVDLVDGTTLKDLIHGRASGHPQPGDALWLPFLLGLLRGVASALGAAHAGGLVHRDVKPGNVLVDREGRPFLVDFGLAREQDSTGATLTRGFVGTPEYASPEQLRGEPVGAASDVFSLGIMAFEGVVGVRPFRSDAPRKRAHDVLFADPSWPAASGIPRDLRAVIEKCLEKRPEERYADASEVEAEFARLLRFEPVLAVPRGRLERVWRRAKRRPGVALGGIGLAVLLATGTTGAIRLREARAALREGEWAERLRGAITLVSKGRDEGRAQLDAFLAEPNVRLGAAGRRADLHLVENEPAKAAALYAAELERGSEEFADWAGYHTARGLVDGEPWRVRREAAGGLKPTSGRDFMVLAVAYEASNDIRAALDGITQAIKLNRLPMIPRQLLQKYLRRLGGTSEAVRELVFAARLMPQVDPGLICQLAQLLHCQHRFEEEEQTLVKALEEVPEEPQLLAELAICKLRLGQPEVALDLSRRAFAAAPEEGRIVEALVLNLLSGEQHGEAHALLRDAALALPEDPHVLSSRARLALHTGALDEAARLAEELAEIGTQDEVWQVPALELRGRIQVARAAYPEALATFQDLEARKPEIMDWPLLIGTILEKIGDFAGAETAVDRALELGPIEPEVLWAKASLLRVTGRLEDALATLGHGLWRPADADKTYYWMAVTWLDLGQPGAAMFYAREAVKAHEDWLEARDLLARCQAAAEIHTDAVLLELEASEDLEEPAGK